MTMGVSVRNAAALFLALFVAACAGREFDRVTEQELVFNQTTMSEIRGRLGDPQSTTLQIKNGAEIRSLTYAYASMGTPLGVLVGMPSARAQVFKFHDGKLVGHEYASSFLHDATGFKDSVISDFTVGETTRADVEKALGPPAGEWVFPLTDRRGDRAILYAISVVDSQARATSKNLTIVFGPDNVVSDVSYRQSRPN